MRWWVRVLLPTGLFDALLDYVRLPDRDKLAELSLLIFPPKEVGHSIFLADNLRDVSRVAIAFGLAHHKELQARAVAWGENADLVSLRQRRKIEKSSGKTPDRIINDRHYDIHNATDEERRQLIASIVRANGMHRWRRPMVARRAKIALRRPGQIDRAELKPLMIQFLEEIQIL